MSSDHDHDTPETGPWPMGWAVATGAAVLAALLASAIGGAGGTAALLIGVVSFGVFGVLLGAGGVERAAPGDDHGHHHGHDHGHSGGHH